MIEKQQALIAKTIDLLIQKFGNRAVLRGGMALRILGSPRFTNDIDMLFIPYKSKKDIVPEIIECLRAMPDCEMSHSLNSKCLRIVLTSGDTSIQVEAKAAMQAETAIASTRLIARPLNLPPRMLHVADHSVALANKMAAWNERRLIRDLYDICFFLQMNIRPDIKTLESRLKKPAYSKMVKSKDHFKGNTIAEFFELLQKYAAQLSDEEITTALSDYLPPEETVGLAMQFRVTLNCL